MYDVINSLLCRIHFLLALASSEAVAGDEDDVTSLLDGLDSLMNDDADDEGCHAAEEFAHSLPRNQTHAGEIHVLLEQHGKSLE